MAESPPRLKLKRIVWRIADSQIGGSGLWRNHSTTSMDEDAKDLTRKFPDLVFTVETHA